MTPYKRIGESNGHVTVISRSDVIDGYETHKSSVDIANNRRNNLTSHHDVISIERWEMRFLGFILGICEVNAFSCYKVFAEDGEKCLRDEDLRVELALTKGLPFWAVKQRVYKAKAVFSAIMSRGTVFYIVAYRGAVMHRGVVVYKDIVACFKRVWLNELIVMI
ncbi:hypothetical protein BDF21DRAFT_398491 [Thamnidium elegans]|nr:hypothetical protein BDF21DRAFT_398491 [Thamnidium elegans]